MTAEGWFLAFGLVCGLIGWFAGKKFGNKEVPIQGEKKK